MLKCQGCIFRMIYIYIYIYLFFIYPQSLSFAGDQNGWLGWGGVGDGMITFLAHAHIFESIAQKAWDNVSAQCFAVVQK